MYLLFYIFMYLEMIEFFTEKLKIKSTIKIKQLFFQPFY